MRPGDVRFRGCHPWHSGEGFDAGRLRAELAAAPGLGVGEIGLDRLRERAVSDCMRRAFEEQLRVAAEFARPVVLHGAKCWGEVVRSCRAYLGRIPAFLFHGFSRSAGLLPDIAALNGFVSVGPAVLNGHAVNYRELVKAVPQGMLLVETDRSEGSGPDAPGILDVAAEVARLRGVAMDALEAVVDRNAAAFASGL